MDREYRIMAYFKTSTYGPRSYKRKIYKTLEDAKKDYKEALAYYSSSTYEGHFGRVVIESRTVSEWKEDAAGSGMKKEG